MDAKLQQILNDVCRYSYMVNNIVKCIANSLLYLDSFRAGDARVELAKALNIDTGADEYRRRIIEDRLTVIEDSIVRGYIHNILRMLDRVAEWAKESVRYLDLMPYMEIPSPIRDHIHEMVKVSVWGIEKVVEALELIKKGEYNSAVEICKEIEVLEEKVDELLHSARKNLIAFSSKIQSPIIILFLKDFIESIETMTDYEEDVADIVRALAIYLKP